jgi:transcriptional regulator with XRE-family HTH domain
MKTAPPFARAVVEAMSRRGLGLRELCRRADVDPSLLSKMLAGKRPPPADRETLGRLARALELDSVELVVAAGLIPAEWSALSRDPGLLRAVHRLAAGGGAAAAEERTPVPERARPVRASPRAAAPSVLAPRGLSEELL